MFNIQNILIIFISTYNLCIYLKHFSSKKNIIFIYIQDLLFTCQLSLNFVVGQPIFSGRMLKRLLTIGSSDHLYTIPTRLYTSIPNDGWWVMGLYFIDNICASHVYTTNHNNYEYICLKIIFLNATEINTFGCLNSYTNT